MPPFVCIQTAFCYIMESLKQMPFAKLTNSEIIGLFAEHSQSWDDLMQDNSLRDHICYLYGDTDFRSLNCTYITPEHFSHSFSRTNAVELSVFHINIVGFSGDAIKFVRDQTVLSGLT